MQSLKTTDDLLVENFRSLNTRKDIADLLEISDGDLIYYLYRLTDDQKYNTFQINKKLGGVREIISPINSLKILQQKLNYTLSLVNEYRPTVHGFRKDKSIVTNASQHVSKRYVFNLDLSDFFPSINFGRVRGLFLTRPFNFNEEVSTVLAQLCCYKGFLPQGAPTSPIISNMICFKLDGQLQKLAKESGCSYSRYADDITFSSNNKKILKNIVLLNGENIDNKIDLSDGLRSIILSNKFDVNEKKVRLAYRYNQQVVTGLKVNEKVNVSRKFIRQVKAMLHAWEKYGLADSEEEYYKKYYHSQKNPSWTVPKFEKVVRGKINFLKM